MASDRRLAVLFNCISSILPLQTAAVKVMEEGGSLLEMIERQRESVQAHTLKVTVSVIVTSTLQAYSYALWFLINEMAAVTRFFIFTVKLVVYIECIIYFKVEC